MPADSPTPPRPQPRPGAPRRGPAEKAPPGAHGPPREAGPQYRPDRAGTAGRRRAGFQPAGAPGPAAGARCPPGRRWKPPGRAPTGDHHRTRRRQRVAQHAGGRGHAHPCGPRAHGCTRAVQSAARAAPPGIAAGALKRPVPGRRGLRRPGRPARRPGAPSNRRLPPAGGRHAPSARASRRRCSPAAPRPRAPTCAHPWR